MNKYEKYISGILGASEVNVISSKRYESNAIGEWYIIEKYVLSDNTIKELALNKTSNLNKIEEHPILKDHYWTGWYSLSEPSLMHNILFESTHFQSSNLLVQEYKTCCHSDIGCFCIMIHDTLEINNDLFEKIAVVMDTTTNTLFICNYHY